MTSFFQRILTPKKWKWCLYILVGIVVYTKLYFGISNFFTTAYTYSLAGLLSYYLSSKYHLASTVSLMIYAVLISLFTGEFLLRYVIRYPLSYGEQNGKSYILFDRYGKLNNIRFMYWKGRADIHTVEFDPGEIRDNDCGDYMYANDTCNPLGFRGTLPPKNKKIILVLGDSFAEGAGAPADSSIPALLRQYITAHDSSTDVFNAGVAGNDIFFDWKMVQKLAVKYALKQLIFLINTTDINDVASRGGSERFCPDGGLQYKPRPWWEPVYAVSYISRLFAHNLLKLDYNLQTPEQVNQASALALAQIGQLIKTKIMPWAKQKGVPVLFVAHPLKHEFEGNNSSYQLLLQQLQAVKETRVINCEPVLKAHGTANQLYWPHDWHFKPEGYALISNLVLDSCYR